MTGIQVQEQNEILVVDSRSIAEELGIEPYNLLGTIERYQDQLEQSFGPVLFDSEKLKGRGRPQRFAFLTEEQATFVMTLSRNTEKVVGCKLKLVKAFTEAKKRLHPELPSQREQLENYELGMKLIDRWGGADERFQERIKEGILNLLLAGGSKTEYEEITVSDRCTQLGYVPSPAQASTIGKRLAKSYREKYKKEPVEAKRYIGGKNRPVKSYTTKDIDLMDAAIESVMGGDVKYLKAS